MASKEFFPYKPKKSKWKAYCAVDVGLITCGYAYSFKDADNIWINENWADHLCYFAPRAPSAVLYKNGLPIDFGYTACEKYIQMSEEERSQTDFFYPGLLNDTDNIQEEMVEGVETGKQFKELSDIEMNHKVSLCLLLGQHCKKEIEEKYQTFQRMPEKFVWIFMVPSAWDIEENARFRKKIFQAYKMEFQSEFNSEKYQLKIVKTTEALWMAVRSDAKKQLESGLFHVRKSKKKEKAVLLVHSGGTRTELSLHTRAQGRVPIDQTTIHTGGVNINQIFEHLLKKSLQPHGDDIISKMKERHLGSWIQFMLSFELSKPAFCYSEFEDVEMDIQYGFAREFFQIAGKELVEILGSTSHDQSSKVMSLSKYGKLVFSAQTAGKICKNIAASVGLGIKKMMKGKDVDVSGIILTGGFGESSYVREYFLMEQEKKNMEPMRLHTPELNPLILPIGAILCVKDSKPKLEESYAIMIRRNIVKDDRVTIRLKKWGGVETVGILYALFHQYQEIEVGRSFMIGPIDISDIYKDTISIYALPEHLDVALDGRIYYYGTDERLEEATKLGNFTLKIPSSISKQSYKLRFRVVMDRRGFKTTVIMDAENTRAETSLMTHYV